MAESSLKLGSRVSIIGKETLGLGTVRFVGETSFQTGIWVGIELEQAAGKNDGSVQGQKYFACKANHGLFVRENQVTVVKEEITSPKPKIDKAKATSETPTSKAKTGSSTTSPVVGKETKPKTTTTTSKTKEGTPTSSTKTDKTKTTTPKSTTTTTSTTTSPEPTPPTSRRSSISSTTSDVTIATPPSTTTPPPTPSPTVSMTTTTTTSDSASSEDKTETASVTSNASGATRNESVDKLLRALKELNDFKVKAQDTIRGLQGKLKEAITENDKLIKEKSSEKEVLDKDKEKMKKEHEKEVGKLQKEIEKMKEEYEEQISSINDNLEMVTLDREIAEEKAESLEQELEKLKGQINIMEMSTSNNKQESSSTDNSSDKVNEEEFLSLMDQNDKLKEALLKLRDFSLAEKQEKDKRIKDLERENKQIIQLQDKITKLENELTVSCKTIEELSEAVDASTEAEQIAEQLTSKNLALEEQISELQSTVEELEDLRDIAEEIEENQNAAEKKLRSELYAKEIEILDQATVISNLKNLLSEKDRMGDQFRSLVKSLQDQLNILKAKEEESLSQANELSNQSHHLLSENIQLQSKILKASSLSIDRELSNLSLSQSDTLVNFVKDYLPKAAFSLDLDSISVHLFFKRLIFKCNLICQNIEKYQLSQSSFTSDEIEYFWSMKYSFENLIGFCKDLDLLMETTDVDNYIKLGSLNLELLPLESKLDVVIHLLKEEELTTSFPIEDINNTLVSKINNIHNIYINSNDISVSILLQRKLQPLLYRCNLLLLEERKIQNLLTERSNSKTILLSIPTVNTIRRCVEFMKKISTTLVEYQPVEGEISNISETLHGINQILDQSIHIFKQIYSNLIDSLQDTRDANSNTILDILNNVLVNKLELDIDWNWLDKLFSAIHNNLKDTSDKLLNSSIPVVSIVDKSKKSPYLLRAEFTKSTLSDAVNLKSHLEEKNQEILEQKKLLQMKANEIQELQWKEQALDKKIEKFLKNDEKLNQRLAEELTKRKEQEKMYTEALDTIQKDVDSLSQDNRSLKEKLNKLETFQDKPKTVEVISSEDGIETVTSSAQVLELKAAIKYLRSECTRLRSQLSSKTLFDVDIVDTGNTIWHNDADVENNVNDSSIQKQQIVELNKELNQLVKETRLKCANATVVSIGKSNQTSASALLHLKNTELTSLASRINSTKAKLQTAISGHTNTGFKSFIPPVQEQSKCLGKITIPIGNMDYSQKMSVNVATLDKLHSMFTQL